MKREKEKGFALILTLIMLSVLSIMAVSFIFLSQSETWSTMNYRLMSQARDGAEAGINSAANFLLNQHAGYPYVPPDDAANTPNDPITAYKTTTYPVSYSNNLVVLSADSNVSSNYNDSTVQSNFNTDGVGKGSLMAGGATVNYNTTATLLAMRQVIPYGSTTAQTVQTWLITSDGTVSNGIRTAREELTLVLERPIMPAFSYGAFGQSGGCGALNWSGGGVIDSYDSSNIAAGTQAYGGNVGTNGNLTESGATTTINGSLSTPRTGTGTCTAGSVTAESGSATPTGGLIELPQNITYLAPTPPSPTPPTSNLNLTNTNSCGSGGSAVPGCTYTPTGGGYFTLAPCPTTGNPPVVACTTTSAGNYGDLSVAAGNTLHLGIAGATTPATYHLNSITLTGNSAVIIDGPVVLNVAGCAASGCPNYLTNAVDFTGGSLSNASLVPMNFQIQYAGTGNIKLNGGAQSSGLVYAPNASVSLTGGSAWYGAIVGNTVSVSGDTNLHYDRNLQNSSYTIGPWMTQSFSWVKF